MLDLGDRITQSRWWPAAMLKAAMLKSVPGPVQQGAVAADEVGQALEDLMGKLLMIRGLLEAEERLPKREPRADPMSRLLWPQWVNGYAVHQCGRLPLGPPAEPPALAWRRPRARPGGARQSGNRATA